MSKKEILTRIAAEIKQLEIFIKNWQGGENTKNFHEGQIAALKLVKTLILEKEIEILDDLLQIFNEDITQYKQLSWID